MMVTRIFSVSHNIFQKFLSLGILVSHEKSSHNVILTFYLTREPLDSIKLKAFASNKQEICEFLFTESIPPPPPPPPPQPSRETGSISLVAPEFDKPYVGPYLKYHSFK